jgi:biotin carboxyl carrier protein
MTPESHEALTVMYRNSTDENRSSKQTPVSDTGCPDRLSRTGCVAIVIVTMFSSMARAQTGESGPQPVVIQRTMIRLTQPDDYRIPTALEPGRQVTLVAPFDGVIRALAAVPGKRFDIQGELATFDSRRITLLLARAQAGKRLAEIELSQARVANVAQQIELAEAKLDLANADLNLAEFDRQATSVRAPYVSTVLGVHVQVGQTVRAGDPLVTVGDLQTLTCRVPVDRKSVKKGQSMQVTVEDATASGEVIAVLPLSDEQQKFRDLAVSVAMAELVFANRTGALEAGQSVFPKLLPEDPVARVPLTSLKTSQSGNRIVQVLRNHVVRHVPVRLHGQIGKEDVFVSGPFTEHDEVIISTSVELADSTAVQPSTPERFGSQGNGTSSEPTGTGSKPPRRKVDAAGF